MESAKLLGEDIGKSGATNHQDRLGRRAKERASSLGQAEYVGEILSFGESHAQKVVLQLIVDDGVMSRGNRKMIFDPKFQ